MNNGAPTQYGKMRRDFIINAKVNSFFTGVFQPTGFLLSDESVSVPVFTCTVELFPPLF